MAWLGVRWDAKANARNAASIAAPDSAVEIWVLPTDEEWMIAQGTLGVLVAGEMN